jgi:hypothetical protein
MGGPAGLKTRHYTRPALRTLPALWRAQTLRHSGYTRVSVLRASSRHATAPAYRENPYPLCTPYPVFP